ncbi:acyl-CoA carboxylase subunit epsilon [Streptomyces prunicolor]|uniref:acyl-CoA carboxylase subunit epsilon n=1 Tax=Streptomyces prunicolor TaxID=67348 RepID=UPI00371C5960
MPDIQVRRGHATPEEIAALVTVLMARAAMSRPTPPSSHRTPNWHRLERALRHSGARGWSREHGAGRPLAATSPGRA